MILTVPHSKRSELSEGEPTMTIGAWARQQLESNPQLIRQEGVRQVAAGFYHSLYAMKDGFGALRNLFGQLGLGDQLDRNRSTLVFPSGVRQVTTSKRHTLIVKTDGSLWARARTTLANSEQATRTIFWCPP